MLAAAMFFFTPAMAQQQVQTVQTEAGMVTVTTLASGLNYPWGMVFLPDGRLLPLLLNNRFQIYTRFPSF